MSFIFKSKYIYFWNFKGRDNVNLYCWFVIENKIKQYVSKLILRVSDYVVSVGCIMLAV